MFQRCFTRNTLEKYQDRLLPHNLIPIINTMIKENSSFIIFFTNYYFHSFSEGFLDKKQNKDFKGKLLLYQN